MENEGAIHRLNEITQTTKGLAAELRQIIDMVKSLDYSNKQVTNQLTLVNHAYEEK